MLLAVLAQRELGAARSWRGCPSARKSAPSPSPNHTTRARVMPAIAATRLSSTLSTATALAGSSLTSSAFARWVISRLPKSPAWAKPTLSSTATSGFAIGDEVGDVAEVVRAHLDDEVAGVLVDRQHGQRRADLVVERPLRRDGRAEPGQDRPQHVLGRGLAVGAGDPDHRQRALGAYPADNDTREVARAVTPFATTICGTATSTRCSVTTRAAPLSTAAADEQVAVGGLAGQGEEDGPLPHPPGIGLHRPGDHGVPAAMPSGIRSAPSRKAAASASVRAITA